MEKLSLRDIVIEVTRRCNMSCSHCLRGDVQNKNISLKHIDKLLSQVESVGSVTFSGGEPSLNVDAINYFLKRAKELNIPVAFFYIAHNGKDTTREFIHACIDLYEYCDEKDSCSVELSNDVYHIEEGGKYSSLLHALRFSNIKYPKKETDYFNNSSLINEGRAAENFATGREVFFSEINCKSDFNDSGEIYLNCNGDIINGCNWSYEHQEEQKLCTVAGLTKFYNQLPD